MGRKESDGKMILELLMIYGAVAGVIVAGDVIFGRIFDKRMEREDANK